MDLGYKNTGQLLILSYSDYFDYAYDILLKLRDFKLADFIYKYLPVGVKSELDKDKSLINLQGDKLTQARSTVFYNWMSTNPAKIGKFFEELAKK